MRVMLRAAFFAVLAVVGLIYFIMPSHAQEACPAWVADMVEDEGGPVLLAHTCSDDNDRAYLALGCYQDTIRIDYDIAFGTQSQPGSEDKIQVEFVTDGGIETIELQHQEMTGMFSGDTPANGALVKLLKSSASMLLRDVAAGYPVRSFSLKGSSAAITTLVERCN